MTHAKVSTYPDGSDAKSVHPSDWNAAHTFAGGAQNSLLMRDTTQSDGSNWTASPVVTSILVGSGATAGNNAALALGNANASLVMARNNANNANLELLSLGGANDKINLGAGTTALQIGTGNVLVGLGGYNSSFPALKRVSVAGDVAGTGLGIRLGDDSGDTSITAKKGLFSGYVIITGPYISIGTNPASSGTGTINLPNASTVKWAGNGSLADLSMLQAGADNNFYIGDQDSSGATHRGVFPGKSNDTILGNTANPWYSLVIGGGYVSIGTNPAGAGALRLPHGSVGQILSRNSANTSDKAMISFGNVTADTVTIGDASSQTIVGGSDPGGTDQLRVSGALTINDTKLMTTKTSFTNGAAAQTATLTNGPTAGNPTKWIPVNDNGTTRYIPSW